MAERPLVTRQQAIDAGLKRYYTGLPCKRGHVAERFTSTSGCLECVHPRPTGIRPVGSTHKKLAHAATLLFDRRANADQLAQLKAYLQQCADHWATVNEEAFEPWCTICEGSGKVFTPEFGRCPTCGGRGTINVATMLAGAQK
jgi:RecJ-like exonuclease